MDWNQARQFARWVDGDLPTEKQWEFAAKGGENYEYAGSNNLNEVGWYDANSNESTHPVDQKKANGYGLYDMSGNVWEWTLSKYSPGSSKRVFRGGCWNGSASLARVTNRNKFRPSGRLFILGFRVVRSVR